MKNCPFYRIAAVLTIPLFFVFTVSCTVSESGLKKSIGSVNELLIVTNDKAQWEGPLGDTIRSVFAAPIPELFQPEPIFDLINVADENFKDIFEKYHTIFIADINPQATEARSETFRDKWAEPQRVIRVTAPDLDSFVKELFAKKESFLKLFIALERERTLTINQLSVNIPLSGEVENKFGIFLPITGGFYKAKEAPDFMWIRHKVTKARQDAELSIMIYSMDYQDTVVFDPRHIIQWRNTLTMEHIPGPSPQSFMKVTREIKPPVFDTITDFPGGYAVETRGLWEVENDFMGGAFVNYTFVNQATNKVITLDGYVYNPNDDKKNFLRQLEAIFFAMKFSSEE
jgi:hypothetical protein